MELTLNKYLPVKIYQLCCGYIGFQKDTMEKCDLCEFVRTMYFKRL